MQAFHLNQTKLLFQLGKSLLMSQALHGDIPTNEYQKKHYYALIVRNLELMILILEQIQAFTYFKNHLQNQYYGILQEQGEKVVLQDLPIEYCRTRYKDFNKELSSKAYRLDIIRLDVLVSYLEKNQASCDVGDYDLAMLQGFVESGDYADDVVLSKVKPSYANDRIEAGDYGIWLICGGYYDVEYLGHVPKHVGDGIIKLGGLQEAVELDVCYSPDFDGEVEIDEEM